MDRYIYLATEHARGDKATTLLTLYDTLAKRRMGTIEISPDELWRHVPRDVPVIDEDYLDEYISNLEEEDNATSNDNDSN